MLGFRIRAAFEAFGTHHRASKRWNEKVIDANKPIDPSTSSETTYHIKVAGVPPVYRNVELQKAGRSVTFCNKLIGRLLLFARRGNPYDAILAHENSVGCNNRCSEERYAPVDLSVLEGCGRPDHQNRHRQRAEESEDCAHPGVLSRIAHIGVPLVALRLQLLLHQYKLSGGKLKFTNVPECKTEYGRNAVAQLLLQQSESQTKQLESARGTG